MIAGMSSVPEPRAAFLRTALARLPEDPRVAGVAAGEDIMMRME
jgi:hypothetical protein